MAVAGHAAVHLAQLLVQQAGLAVVYHQHRGRVERPAACAVDADGRAVQQCSGAAVHPPHFGNIVVNQKAFNQHTFAKQVAVLFFVQLGVLFQCRQQQALQLQHAGDLLPVEHAAHQHQQGNGVGFQYRVRAGIQIGQYGGRTQCGQQHTDILLDHAQICVIIAARAVGGQGLQIFVVLFKPKAVAVVIQRLLLMRQGAELARSAVFHHVVEAVQVAVRQALDKGIAAGQFSQQVGGIVPPGNKAAHLNGKLIGQPQYGQKLLLHRRQRADHRGGEQAVNVGAGVRERAAVLQGLQAQING